MLVLKGIIANKTQKNKKINLLLIVFVKYRLSTKLRSLGNSRTHQFCWQGKIIDWKIFNKGTAAFNHFFKNREKNNIALRIRVFFQFSFIETTYHWPDLFNLITRKCCLFELIDVDKEVHCRHQANERDMMLWEWDWELDPYTETHSL